MTLDPGMTELWLDVAAGRREAPHSCAQLAGGQVCFFGCEGSNGTCSHVPEM